MDCPSEQEQIDNILLYSKTLDASRLVDILNRCFICYKQRLSDYYDQSKYKLLYQNDTFNPSSLSNYRGYDDEILIKEIKNNKDKLILFLDDYISEFNRIYDNTGNISMRELHNITVYMGLLFCFHPFLLDQRNITSKLFQKFFFENDDLITNSFPLFVDDGFFEIENWLLCAEEGIYLYGVPSMNTSADGYKVCPTGFMGHDIQHSYVIINGKRPYPAKENLAYIKKLHNSINNDVALTDKDKLFLIGIIFGCFHELGTDYFKIPPFKLIKLMITDYELQSQRSPKKIKDKSTEILVFPFDEKIAPITIAPSNVSNIFVETFIDELNKEDASIILEYLEKSGIEITKSGDDINDNYTLDYFTYYNSFTDRNGNLNYKKRVNRNLKFELEYRRISNEDAFRYGIFILSVLAMYRYKLS